MLGQQFAELVGQAFSLPAFTGSRYRGVRSDMSCDSLTHHLSHTIGTGARDGEFEPSRLPPFPFRIHYPQIDTNVQPMSYV